jgi:hypothetical protein
MLSSIYHVEKFVGDDAEVLFKSLYDWGLLFSSLTSSLMQIGV